MPPRAPPSEWTPSLLSFNAAALPALPDITDSALRAKAATHKSALPSVTSRSSFAHRVAETKSNRRLEWVGDACLHWILSWAIQKNYPKAVSGALSLAREKVTANATLSYISLAYALPEALRATSDPLSDYPVHLRQKIAADALEAHVGAVLEEALDPLRCSVLLKWAEAFATSTVFPELDNLVRQSNEKSFQVAPQSVPAKRGPEPATSEEVWRFDDEHRGKDGWTSTVWFNGRRIASGAGRKKSEAREAARV
ncbi:uncharacterized protein JCM10292_005709 [Rhodotorula paludigena]|uniref:uncharacterized protein n=1 Tax=Rhodotorula paludigena TaxID=86838 RepID=UPI00317C3DE0